MWLVKRDRQQQTSASDAPPTTPIESQSAIFRCNRSKTVKGLYAAPLACLGGVRATLRLEMAQRGSRPSHRRAHHARLPPSYDSEGF